MSATATALMSEAREERVHDLHAMALTKDAGSVLALFCGKLSAVANPWAPLPKPDDATIDRVIGILTDAITESRPRT